MMGMGGMAGMAGMGAGRPASAAMQSPMAGGPARGPIGGGPAPAAAGQAQGAKKTGNLLTDDLFSSF